MSRKKKKVLMISFHYPPFGGSSNVHRIMSFSQHLNEMGWEPRVLTVKPRAYAEVDENNYDSSILKEIDVTQTFAFDVTRDFSILNRYPGFLAIPDRWSSWWFSAFPKALQIIKREKPDLIWSTSPIATSHLIAASLKKVTNIPWIAEFRDPMYFECDQHHKLEKCSKKWLEAMTVKQCDRVVTVTEGACRLFQSRYGISDKKITVIENGYDEKSIGRAEQKLSKVESKKGPLTILHSGRLYPAERDPSHLFQALNMLKKEGSIFPDQVQFIFRGCGNDNYFQQMVIDNGVEDFVKIEPMIPYVDALAECLKVDALMVIQGRKFNNQVPAKIYEYLRVRRPIVGLVDLEGDTAKILKKMGGESILPMTSIKIIKNGLKKLVDNLAKGKVFVPELAAVTQYSRYSRVRELGKNLDEVYEQSCLKFQRSY